MNNLDYKFIETLREEQLFQHVTIPTRGRGTDNPNVLDLIITNEEQLINQIECHSPLGNSDHCVIQFQIICKSRLNQYRKTIKQYDKADFDSMRKDLSAIDWKGKLNNTSVETEWDILKNTMVELENTYIPTKTLACNSNRKGNIPINAKTRKLIRRKDRL